jgi:5-aminopentanamidase
MKFQLFTGAFLFFLLGSAAAAELNINALKVACAQIDVTDDPLINTAKILSFIDKAASQDVQIVLFPETALSGYAPYHFIDKPIPGKEVLESGLEKVCKKAAETGVHVVLGTSSYENGGVYNIVYYIDGSGEIIGSHDKTHGTGGKYYLKGREVRTFETQGMKFGMQVCYDARFPEAWRMQALEGADVIFHVSHAAGGGAWKTPVWEAHVRSRAAENGIWVVSCNVSGPIQAGKSYIVSPRGLMMAESNQEVEEMITAVIDLSEAKRGILYSRRKDIYRVAPMESSEPEQAP